MTDIVERLMGFDRYGATATERVKLREESAFEIARLRREVSEFTKLKEYAKSLGQETYLDLHAENVRLRKGIQDYLDGDYARPGINRKVDQCPHGMFGWDACENCIDAHFAALLNPTAPANDE